jgi:hypothetical protein
MRTTSPRLLLPAALLALLLAAPSTWADVAFGGNLGLSLTRSDQWGGPSHDSSSIYQFTGSLHLDASLFAPGTLDLGGSASYLGYRATGGTAGDALNYQLRLSALARFPVHFSGSASRDTYEFTSSTNQARIGNIAVDGRVGTVVVSPEGLPILQATVTNITSTSSFTGTAPVTTDMTGVAAAITQTVEALNYSLSYQTNRSAGDYAETNYLFHSASLAASAELAPNLSAQVTANYNLREPTLVARTNPRIDNQSLQAMVRWSEASETSAGGSYQYASSIFEAPESAIRQSLSHSLSAYWAHRLSAEWSFDVGGGAALGETGLGASSQRSTGEQVSSAVRWSRFDGGTTLGASLSGSLGLIQPGGAPNGTSWSVAASGDLSRPIGTWVGNASLGATHDENSGASSGTRNRVYANLSANGLPLGWSFHGLLSSTYSLVDSPAFGSSRALNTRLDSQVTRAGITLGLAAGITDDLSEALTPGAPPTSPLIPVSYNTQSRYATALASLQAFSRVYLTFIARHISYTSSGRDTQWENGLSVQASYNLGAFQFSLFDVVTNGGSGTSSSGTQNVLFFSVTRSFGR